MKFHKQHYLVLGALLIGCVGLLYWKSRALRNLWRKWTDQPLIWAYSGEFHEQIKNADRIVLRDGGYGCCLPADKHKVLFETTDPAEIQLVYTNLQFWTPIEGSLMPCSCCGDVGIDWYQGKKRLALTAFHERGAIRWDGFRGGDEWRPEGEVGDAPLTRESTKWLTEWLTNHGAPPYPR